MGSESSGGTVAADLARTVDTHVEACMVVGGRAIDVHALVAEVPVIEGTFEIEHLRPGPYRVTLRKGLGVLAHAEATIARATTSEVHLTAYRSSVFVPIETDDGHSAGGLEVRRVERGLFRRSAGEWRWETCAGYEVSQQRGGLRISGLPEATVRIEVLADGFEETWSAAIPLSEETETVGPPMVLVRTRDPEG